MFVSADFSTVYDAAFISVKYCAYQCGGTKSVIVITIHTYVHMFSSPFLGLPRWAGTRKVKPIWILLKRRESEWQWHQLGHVQVCTSLQTDNHASTPPLSFVQAGCRSCCPTNSVIALKATKSDRDVTVTYSRNCSSFKLDSLHIWRQQQTNELFNQIVNKPEHCLHYLLPSLQENSLSLIVSDLPTNCRASFQRLTDSRTLLFVILWTVYSVNDVFLLFVFIICLTV